MALTVTLFEKGYLAGGVSLVYNAGVQDAYKMKYGQQLQSSDTDVLLHVPDYGEVQPVRAVDLDRMFYFDLNVEGADNDAVINAVARLMRWVDGANSPALRYHMLGDAVELRLRITPNGATNYTESSVKWGFVDAGAAWFNEPAGINDMAFGVVVALHLPPYSEGASISLTNHLSNGDFLVESTTSGLAQGWSLTGTPTATLPTDTYLVNGVSQKIVTDNSTTEGIRSPTATAAAGSDLVAFAWIYTEAGGDAVELLLEDGSSVDLDSAKTTDAGLLSITDRNGNTWIRVEVSGNNGANTGAQLRIQRLTGDASVATTYYIDAVYIEVGTTTIPSGGWSSYYSLDNRGDETNAAMGQRNWLDLALIPGDAPALVRHKFAASFTASSRYLYMGRVFDGKALATDQTHWVESDEFGAVHTSDVNGAWTTGTGTSDNHFYRFTASGGTGSSDRYAGFSGQNARDLLRTPRRVFVRIRSSSTSSTFTFSTQSPTDIQQAKTVSVDNANVWELHDLGTMNGLNVLPDDDGSETPASYPIMRLIIAVASVPNGATADFDLFWLPWTTEFLMVKTEFNWTDTESMWVDGWQRGVIQEVSGQFEPNRAGTMWEAVPGLRSNRFTLATTPLDATWYLTDAYDFTVDIIPRTRQLLGTV